MRIFTGLYHKVIKWSEHPHAPYYLTGVSIAESSFFPIPPDIMLASMTMAKPAKAWRYALITTLGSVFGGILGYMIGKYGFGIIHPLIIKFGYEARYNIVLEWFGTYGFWAICIAGFTPIPYKIFTISAGVFNMSFFPFVLASLLSRGLRFYLVSIVCHYTSNHLREHLVKYIEFLGWSFIVLSVLVYWIWFY